MWHRLQVLITKEQHKWLKKESLRREKSIGEIIRSIIAKAMGEKKE